MDKEKWLNGWYRSGKIVSMSNGTRCSGCGRNFGPALTVFHEDYTPPKKEPDWPFEEANCPVCTHTGFEAGGRLQDFQVNKWIEINSQLPMQGEKVLCWQKDIGYVIAYWGDIVGSGIYWAEEEHGASINTEDCSITHWMLLPKPPQEADG